MRKIIDNDILTMVSRVVIGLIFIYASFYKIIEPASFARSIWFYHMVPGSLINLMALILPMLELILGLALIGGLFYRGSVIWANLLTVVFLIALGSAMARGIDIDCGCFKASKAASGSVIDSLLFDVGMLILTVQLFLSRSKRWMLSKSS